MPVNPPPALDAQQQAFELFHRHPLLKPWVEHWEEFVLRPDADPAVWRMGEGRPLPTDLAEAVKSILEGPVAVLNPDPTAAVHMIEEWYIDADLWRAQQRLAALRQRPPVTRRAPRSRV